METDYQVRKDIDRFKQFLDGLESDLADRGLMAFDLNELLSRYYDKSEVEMLLADVETGGINLSDYVKKDDLTNNAEYDIDLNLNFGLSGLDDNITIDMDIVNYIVNKTINTRGVINGS